MRRFAALLALVAPLSALAADDPGAVVRKLYADYKPWKHGVSLLDAPLARYFDADLVRLMNEEKACMERTHSVGRMDWDPVVDGQVIDDKGYINLKFKMLTTSPEVVYQATFLKLAINPNSGSDVRYTLVKTAAGWRIHDIAWGPGRPGMRALLSQPCE
jgi:hypothetical protein